MIPLTDSEGRVVAYVEVDATKAVVPAEDGADGSQDFAASGTGGRVEEAGDRLRDAGAAIAATCDALVGTLHDRLQGAQADELTVEFGITLGGEVGIPIITKASAEATLSVSVTWRRQ